MHRILQFSRKIFARSFSLYQMQNQKSFFVTILTIVGPTNSKFIKVTTTKSCSLAD